MPRDGRREWTREYFSRHDAMPARGWDAVTVPGAVSGWVALSRKFGKLDFARLFEPALHYARHGFLVTPITARQWADQAEPIMQDPGFRDAFAPNGRTPQPGERFICPGQADTLQDIADTHGESFYRGALAARIAAFARETGGALTEADLAAHQADWVDPIGAQYGELTLHEIGPSGQGIGALMELGMLDGLSGKLGQPDSTDFYHYQIEAMKLAFADINRYVADPASMREVSAEMLLDRAYLATRAGAIDPAEARYL